MSNNANLEHTINDDDENNDIIVSQTGGGGVATKENILLNTPISSKLHKNNTNNKTGIQNDGN